MSESQRVGLGPFVLAQVIIKRTQTHTLTHNNVKFKTPINLATNVCWGQI